jgi:hypothetical protein
VRKAPMTASAQTPQQTLLVERTGLPRIFVRGKSQNRYYAHVHSYVIGPPILVKSVQKVPLYSLSLVAMHGEGNILQGLWSSLIANTSQDVFLEGVGPVTLATPAHLHLGYTLHWNYHQTELPGQDLHAVIESHMLSLWDPVRGVAPLERQRTKKRQRESGKRKQRARKVELSTLVKKEQGEKEEELHRQHFPLFLLMVPGNEQPRRTKNELEGEYIARCKIHRDAYRTAQHFAFLNQRVPWPMDSAWADYLWERGLQRKEITPLTVWSAASKQARPQEEEEETDARSLPLFLEAWLCQPNPTLLPSDLKQARADGRLCLPETPLRILPAPIVVASR